MRSDVIPRYHERCTANKYRIGLDDIMMCQLLKLSYILAGYISTAINDGPGCLMLRCPDPSCAAAVGQDMINSLANEEDKEKYGRYLRRSYIEDNRKVSCYSLI